MAKVTETSWDYGGTSLLVMVPNRPTEALRQSRKRRNRAIAAAFFIFVALIITLESPITRIRHIQVNGNGSIPAGQVLKDAAISNGMSLWQVSQANINHRVKAHQPLVQSVAVTTDFLRGVVDLTIHQKQVVALLVVSGKFYPLLNDGDVYLAASEGHGFTWPIVTSTQIQSVEDGRPTKDPNVAVLCGQLGNISASILAQVSELHLDALGTVTVYLNSGFEIRAKVENLRNQMEVGMTAVNYFVAKGYAPGIIDVTGQPPYQYTPLQGKGGKG